MSFWPRMFDTFNLTGIDTQHAQASLPGTSAPSTAVASKKATEEASAQQVAATAQLQQSQQIASDQAQTALTAKRRAAATSQDVYTSPLGLTTQASTAKKTLLGQ